MDIDLAMLADFLPEAEEQTDLLDQELVRLEAEPGEERLRTIFRVMHTLKGGAGFCGLEKLESLTHRSETLLSRMRDGELPVSSHRISLMLEVQDAVKTILSNLQNGLGEGDEDRSDLCQRLDAAVTAGPEPSVAEPVGEMAELEAMQAELLANMAPSDPGDEMAELMALQAELLAKMAPSPPVDEMAELMAMQAELLANMAPCPASGAPQASATRPAPAPQVPEAAGVRVRVDLLDRMVNLAGELVLARNQLLQMTSGLSIPSLSSICQRVNLLTSELQEQVMQTRMQPISTLLGRFPRIVRDLANQTGKEVSLIMEGQETGLDRSLLEAIKDPLTHIVRNSVDHGLEKPEERLTQGKPRQGQVVLRAFQESGQVVLEITDDGAGVNTDRVLARAIERGLVHPGEHLSHEQILELLFRPGFSTAETVTNLSGRGVGMDVVRSSIEAAGGSVEMTSERGKGSVMRLRLPLTLAILPALLVSAGGERFALPQACLQELVRLEGDQRKRVENLHGAEVFRLRDQLLPVLRLRSVLDFETRQPEVINIVVLQSESVRFGLIVDRVQDTEEIVVKPLPSGLKKLQLYAGATILGDGRVALILDPAALARHEGLKTAQKAEQARQEVGARTQSMLVFTLGDAERFALPLGILTRLEALPADQVEWIEGERVVQYRGQLMRLIDVGERLGHSPASGELLQVMVCGHLGRHQGLIVGDIVDVVRSEVLLDAGLSRNPICMGSAVIAGRATSILDLHSLLSDTRPQEPRIPGMKVLVVDDSPDYGPLTASYFTTAGHRAVLLKEVGQVSQRLAREPFDMVVVELACPGARDLLDVLRSQARLGLAVTSTRSTGPLPLPDGARLIQPYGRSQLLESLSTGAAA